MRRSRHWGLASLAIALGLAMGLPARAGTLLTDPYGVGAPDVLGNPANFDIESLEVQEASESELRIEIRMNFHNGDTTLAGFAVPGSSYASVPVGVGDVLIRGKSSLWAIPVSTADNLGGGIGGIYLAGPGMPVLMAEPATRDVLLPGSIYQVSSVITAGQALGVDPADDLRADQAVWGLLPDFNPTFGGRFPVVTALGGPEIAVLLQITTIGPAFWNDVKDGFDVHFASTTCACDVIDGHVPEPAPFALTLALLTLLATRLCLSRSGGERERTLV